EISKFPPSVAEVETAIPAFIGYVKRTVYNGQDLKFKPTRITSLAEYVEVFGGPFNETFSVTVNASEEIDAPPSPPAFVYKMYSFFMTMVADLVTLFLLEPIQILRLLVKVI
ncbi:MAG: hypothetical protein V5A59_09865, partial [Bacteroidales bacterium]